MIFHNFLFAEKRKSQFLSSHMISWLKKVLHIFFIPFGLYQRQLILQDFGFLSLCIFQHRQFFHSEPLSGFCIAFQYGCLICLLCLRLLPFPLSWPCRLWDFLFFFFPLNINFFRCTGGVNWKSSIWTTCVFSWSRGFAPFWWRMRLIGSCQTNFIPFVIRV